MHSRTAAKPFPVVRITLFLLTPNRFYWELKPWNHLFFFVLNWGTSLSPVTWAGPGWAAAAAPAVFFFGSAAHGGHRLAIWEWQIWKGLCVVLSDKPAFVRTPNHQSEKTLISIFKTLLSSGFYVLQHCPLSLKFRMSTWSCEICQIVFGLQQIELFIRSPFATSKVKSSASLSIFCFAAWFSEAYWSSGVGVITAAPS